MCVDDEQIKKLAKDAVQFQKQGLKPPGSAGQSINPLKTKNNYLCFFLIDLNTKVDDN